MSSKSSKRPDQTNNSEDEDDVQLGRASTGENGASGPIAADSKQSQTDATDVDFVSFPTIPDPELDNTQTLGRILSKTFRKATANASNLVSYPKPKEEPPVAPVVRSKPTAKVTTKSPRKAQPAPLESEAVAGSAAVPPGASIEPVREPNRSISNFNRQVIDDYKNTPRVTSDNRSLRLSTLPQRNPTTNTITSSFINVNAHPINNTEKVERERERERQKKSQKPRTPQTSLKKKGSALSNRISSMFNNLPNDIELSDDSASDSETIHLSSSESSQTPMEENEDHDDFNYNSINYKPSFQANENSAKSNTYTQSTTNNTYDTNKKNTIINNKPTAGNNINSGSSNVNSSSNANTANTASNGTGDSQNTTSTGNNAPSANRESYQYLPSETPETPGTQPEKRLNYNSSYYDFSLYSESTARASPIKAELKRSTSINSVGDSRTLSSFYALKSKDMKKKTSSNLSTVLFDNAKAIIPQEVKKRKRKPKRSSNNPLKNGGIPKVYWMNDAFVSDCLNCFKPFSAFRRKHHCRFCGQIFCSDCTLFISYNQHKEERKNLRINAKKTYSDKLRVCKPCYSDVIVYLSDDSSEEEAETENLKLPEEEVLSNHPLSRIRSVSISSRRDSLLLNENRTILDGLKESTPIREDPVSATHSPVITQSPAVKIYPRLAPKMAIPTTRTGEAVEIPVAKSYNQGSNFALKVPALTNHTHLHNHTHHYHHHHPHVSSNTGSSSTVNVSSAGGGGGNPNVSISSSINTPSSAPSWFKNYAQLRANTSAPDLPRTNSFENISNMILGRSTSTSKLRIKSDRDLHTDSEYADISFDDEVHGAETDEADSDSDSEPNSVELDNESHDEVQDEEDEQAMSLYTLLNHAGAQAALSPKPAAAVMPTLGEFPSMYASDKKLSGLQNTSSFSKIFQPGSTVAGDQLTSFLEEIPRSESLRSRERAHASLERMKSRRRTKSTRNISGLSHGHYTLPSSSHLSSLQLYVQPTSLQPTVLPQKTLKADPKDLSPLKMQLESVKSLVEPISLHDAVPLQLQHAEPLPLQPAHVLPIDTVNPFNTKYSPIEAELSPRAHFVDFSFATVPRDSMSPSSMVFEKQNTRPKEEVYSQLLDFILRQSLEDCDVKQNQEAWMRVLKDVLAHINVLKLTDTLDVRQYVKVKKNLGGSIEETSVLNGLYMTKNIDSKRMSFSVARPKIALLMFPIEYLKQKEQFISLRIIHSQQSVYITNLVSRLVSLEPDIIVVGDSVCGLAQSLLEDAGVTVMSNVKPQVIERISRYTKADIFQSVNDLFFKKGTLGSCERFEVRKYVYRNVIKTYSFFIGNEIETGFTISLRGGNEELLNSIKYAAETMMPGYLNARFEKSLFENHMITFRQTSENHKVRDVNAKLAEIKASLDLDEELRSCEFSLDSTEVVNYVKFFNERRLSLSPASNFSLPTQLVKVIESYYQFHVFFRKNKQIQGLDSPEAIDELWLQEMKINIDPTTLPNLKADLLGFLKYTSEFHLRTLVNEYHTRARVWSNCMGFPSYQLYPVFHKNIHVLHSTVSIKHATPCSGPNIVIIDYYTDNDKCLGLFLDQTYHDSSKICEDCGESFLDHYKTYVHGNAKLDLIIEKFDSISQLSSHFQGKNQRVMWSYCKEEGCNYSTPITAMNDDTYYLSIGKFLEICFYGENVVATDHACDHDYFQSHIRCFGFNDLVIRLEYSSIDSYEVVAPKKQLEFMPEVDIKLKVETFNSIKSKTTKFFQSISKRLNRVKLDTYEKAEEGLLRIEELKTKVDSQLEQIERTTLEIYNSTIPTNHLRLNSILRELQDLGVSWDNEFNDFEKKFLPSEHEITKITQFHLRNFLMDKYSSDSKDAGDIKENDDQKDQVEPKEVTDSDDLKGADEKEKPKEGVSLAEVAPAETSDTAAETAEATAEMAEAAATEEVKKVSAGDIKGTVEDHVSIDSVNIPDSVDSPSNQDSLNNSPDNINKEKTKEIGRMIPSSLYNSNIMDRINRIEQMLEYERSKREDIKKLPPPAPLRHLTSKSSDFSLNEGVGAVGLGLPDVPNKVVQLASLFNKMNVEKISLEFKKQREHEMQKKSHKYKALPIVDSKPIVEIYDKIEDVVYLNDERKQQGQDGKAINANVTPTNSTPAFTPAVTSTGTPIATPEGIQAGVANFPFGGSAVTAKEKNIEIPQPEKISLLKSLTNFWADRSATLWDPLEYPLESHEHTFADSDVIVREDEPSSLVAFCLSSADYKQKISTMESETNCDDWEDDGFDLENNEINNKKINNFIKIEKKFKKKTPNGAGHFANKWEKIMNKNKSNHLKYQFVDGSTNLSCKIFYSEQFEAFRKACGNNDNFIQSLSRCIKWNSSGGKSGSNFLKTLDDRYIVKELSKSELESFVSIAPFYFKYIAQSMFNTLTTAIAKIFGFYQIHIKSNITGKVYKMDFLIMENLFYNHKTTRIFDLKGSMRNRHVQQTGKENEVLLDENMIEYIYESPVFVKEQSKKLLRGSLFNDTSFLSAMDVMDYSLVVGIDSDTKKLYIGIIDWLRTFTWDKKVENWVKGNNLIGGKKGKDPTIVTPKQYRTRFREAMERYLLEVPDIWYEGGR